MEYFDEQLQKLQQQVAKKKHLEAVLQDLNNQKTDLQEKVAQLDRIRQKEQADVERLEGRSLAAFFYGVVGKKDIRLDKERQEAYAAAAKYDVAVRELAAVEEDISGYSGELWVLRGCEENFTKLLEEKTAAIKASGIPEASEISKLEGQLTYLDNQKKEINEAITAGSRADGMADDVLSKLESARRFGKWDLFGGGWISDAYKHSYLDEAQNSVEIMQVQLRRFKTELADVKIHADIQVNINGFVRFADYFFDGLFADLEVLDRITESQTQLQRLKLEISCALDRLEAMLSDITKEQTIIQSNLNELIVKAAL